MGESPSPCALDGRRSEFAAAEEKETKVLLRAPRFPVPDRRGTEKEGNVFIRSLIIKSFNRIF